MIHPVSAFIPIDISGGRLVLSQHDFTIEAVLPIEFRRAHVTGSWAGRWFGPSWASTADQRLELGETGIRLVTEDGLLLTYPYPDGWEVLPEEGPPWPLSEGVEGEYLVWRAERILRFPPVAGGTVLPIGSVLDRLGNQIRFDYDDRGVFTGIEHPCGEYVQVSTEGGRITALTRGDVRVAGFRYEGGNLVEVTAAAGGTTRFRYDLDNRIVRWEDGDGRWCEFGYDDRDRCVRMDGLGSTTRIEYDASGRPAAVQRDR
ncbi:DUF6531 domain-containing protein [Lentzea sp. NPDC058450]|uniref:DUF6531 domain-containing protein n=1 Tax=Lentzea sp. NPDC058450 TaxID=3346505 RepID=UPI00364D2B0C